MKLEEIDTNTTAGNGTEWLSDDAAQLALFKAIRDIKFGLPTDDKLILEGLRNAGLWIARYQPERSTPIGPGEVWVEVCDRGCAHTVNASPVSGKGYVAVRYVRAEE